MRKYIYIIATLLIVACKNEIPFDIKENPPKLVINALFDAQKEANEIILALTGREKATHVKEASIRIYVNGELKDHLAAPQLETTPYGERREVYKTKIRFAPDDVVKIEAETDDGKYRAWAEATAPRPVNIENVDTAIVMKKAIWPDPGECLRAKTTFTDNGKQGNYYRIVMLFDLEIKATSPETLNDTIIYRTQTGTLIANEDVVLTDGRPTTDDEDDALLPSVENKYAVFDNSRINGTYTMITSMRTPYNSLSYLSYQEPGLYEYIERVKVKARIRLISISKAQYFYLRALNIYESNDDDDYLSLPVRFPSNVEGGTGIFGLSVGTDAVVPMEDYIPDFR